MFEEKGYQLFAQRIVTYNSHLARSFISADSHILVSDFLKIT